MRDIEQVRLAKVTKAQRSIQVCMVAKSLLKMIASSVAYPQPLTVNGLTTKI